MSNQTDAVNVDTPDDPEAYSEYLDREQQRQAEHAQAAASPTAQNFAAEGFKAKHDSGVLYQGEFETPSDGTALAVRRHAAALAATGVPLLLRSFSNAVVNQHGVVEPTYVVGIPDEVTREVGHLLDTDIAICKPVIRHVVIRSAEHCKQLLLPRGAIPLERTLEAQMKMRDAIYENTIVYSVWERDSIDPAIARQLGLIKQCWVPCEQNRRMLIESGVPADKVHVVPHPFREDDLIHVCTQRVANAHKGWKHFYSIGRWEPRKGFDRLIQAFLRAFRPGDPATLTIKYSGSGRWDDFLSAEEALEVLAARESQNGWTLASARKHIALIEGRLRRSKIVQIHHENNIYVSPSSGEAWGLPAFDAKLAGNTLVYVPYGGVADFAESSDIAIPYELTPAHPSYRWEQSAKWAACRLEDLAEALTRAAPPLVFRRPPDFERFSMAAVGQRMRDLVDVAVGPEFYQTARPSQSPPV